MEIRAYKPVHISPAQHAEFPDPEQLLLVDVQDAFLRALPAGGWVHFHCRAGKGRTTTFIALYDMLRNAGTVSLKDIVARQSDLIGGYDVLAPEPGGDFEPWKAGVTSDRVAFVTAFYNYARANPNGSPLLWSEWLKTQP